MVIESRRGGTKARQERLRNSLMTQNGSEHLSLSRLVQISGLNLQGGVGRLAQSLSNISGLYYIDRRRTLLERERQRPACTTQRLKLKLVGKDACEGAIVRRSVTVRLDILMHKSFQ